MLLRRQSTGLCNIIWSLLDNTEQDFFLCNVAWSLLDSIAQGFYLCNVHPWLTDNFCEENNLRNVVLTMLGQHCIGIFSSQCCPNTSQTTLHKKIFLQCWPRTHRHVFVGKQPIQCCLDLSVLTLHKKITYAMLIDSP